MTTFTLEERVAILEKKMEELITKPQAPKPSNDWRSTFGMFADDPEFDEILRMGREIREQDTDEDQHKAGA